MLKSFLHQSYRLRLSYLLKPVNKLQKRHIGDYPSGTGLIYSTAYGGYAAPMTFPDGINGVQVNPEGTIVRWRRGFGVVLHINNPYDHNRFDEHLSRALMKELMIQENHPGTKVIIVKGAGSRAFSCGVDINKVYKYALQKRFDKCAELYREYYKTAFYLSNISTPVMTLINGIMVSSGSLLGAYADYACVSDATCYFCPETALGGCPDGGNTFLLGRVNKKYPGLGMFLGLTGARVFGKDLIPLGIATHFAPSSSAYEILERLAHSPGPLDHENLHIVLSHALMEKDLMPKYPSFMADLEAIERCFHNKNSVEEIFAALEQEDTHWSRNTLNALKKCSPTALKVAFRAISRGEHQGLSTCINMEFRINMRQVKSHDWLEGMRARYIQNDPEGPKWYPSRLEDVTDDMVDEFFKAPTWEKDMTCDLHVADEAFWGIQILNIIKSKKGVIVTKPKQDKTLNGDK